MPEHKHLNDMTPTEREAEYRREFVGLTVYGPTSVSHREDVAEWICTLNDREIETLLIDAMRGASARLAG